MRAQGFRGVAVAGLVAWMATGPASLAAQSATEVPATDTVATEVSTAEAPTEPPAASTVQEVDEFAAVADTTMVSNPAPIAYRLERIEVRGNKTSASVITDYVPLKVGDEFDPNSPDLEQARFRLLGTGYFDDVKLSLERGRERGWVVLVVHVKERNTLVVDRVVAGLSRVIRNSADRSSPVRPYAGLGVAERNLFGSGVGVAAAGVISIDQLTGTLLQYGADLRADQANFAGSGFDMGSRLFHNRAREFFGRNTKVANECPPADPSDPEPAVCDPDIEGRRAVVIYNRTGLGFGASDDLGAHVRYSVDWLGERVGVINMPQGADTQRGISVADREPIDFHIESGVSWVSSVQLGLQYDTRDHPIFPRRGDRLQLLGRLGAGIFGSDYDFTRATLAYEHFAPLPWGHVVQLSLLAGTVFGRAPFFYRFYAADLSDLLPPRQLELNLDHRRTHNLLGTSIREMDAEDVAGRVQAEYQWPVIRNGGAIRAMHAYLRFGTFLLGRREDFRLAVPGYNGLARIPIDLTFDLGLIADTDFGLFKVGFSSLIGFLPDLGQDGT